MSVNNLVNLSDRIKELSYTVGTGNMSLAGAANGFSSFGSVYNHNDAVFYAITDGTFYEIGSGVYLSADYDLEDSITQDQIVRFPFRSTNNNQKVNFPAGIKEIYSTYPATHAVQIGSGIGNLSLPQSSGVAFWASNNVLDYDQNIIWDKLESRLGIRTSNPQYTLDVGGNGYQSTIRSSGVIVGSSGIYFPPQNGGDSSYIGGRQLEHYEKNQLDQYAFDNELIDSLTGSSAVLELSGVVNQFILFKQQNAGLVFAGPPSGCTPPCSPAYPSFRQLEIEDIPDLESLYVTATSLASYSGIVDGKLVTLSGVLNNKIITVSGIANDNITLINGFYNTLDNYIDSVSGFASSEVGIVSQNLLTASGALDNKIVSASGSLRNEILASGVTAGSGLVYLANNQSFNLANPSNHYAPLLANNSQADDKILVWEESASGWKRMDLWNLAFAPSGNTYVAFQTVLNSTDHGIPGRLAVDNNYLYACTESGWRRISLGNPFEVVFGEYNPPAAPTNLQATPSNGKVYLTWTAPNNALNIIDYIVQYSGAGAGDYVTFDGVDSRSLATVAGLTNGTLYTFRVAAVDAITNGEYSSTVSATPQVTIPGITNLNSIISPSVDTIQISLVTPDDGGASITGYKVEYTKANSSALEKIVPFSNSITLNAADGIAGNISDLPSGTDYTIRAAALNSVGMGPYSSTLTAKVKTTNYASAPRNFARSSGTTSSVSLSWAAPLDFGGTGATITSYRIYYKLSTDASYSSYSTISYPDTTATITGLTSGLTYNFKIAAVNAAGVGSFSNELTLTIGAAPDAPTGLTVTNFGTNSISLSWTAPVNNGGSAITDYVIQYRLSSQTDQDYVVFNDGASISTSATVTGLNVASYRFRVAAVNEYGTGTYSSHVTASPVTAFISTWNTNATSTGSSGTNRITLPLVLGGTYNFVVNWGDGTTSTITDYNSTQKTHVYATGGTKTLRITGQIVGWEFFNTGDRLKIQTISSWGSLDLSINTGSFAGCSNLNITATDAPVLGSNCSSMFEGCTSLTNPDFSNFNTTSVTNMSYMFAGCSKFNGNVSSWNTSSVTNMTSMFLGCTLFNQDITSWNVSVVTNMSSMFQNAAAFNQDITNWNTGSVTNMSSMLFGATSFSRDLSNLDISNVTLMNNMLRNVAISKTTYDSILTAWGNANKPSKTNLLFNIDQEYSLSDANAVAGRNYLINTKNWKIVDYGHDNGLILELSSVQNDEIDLSNFIVFNTSPPLVLDVNWGDGSGSTLLLTGGDAKTKIYSSGGDVKTLRISSRSGSTIRIGLSNSNPTSGHNTLRRRLRRVLRFGNTQLKNGSGHFWGCSSLISLSSTDAPLMPEDKNLYECFDGCGSFTGSGIELWNTSTISSMGYMFYACSAFNGDITNFDTSLVTNMSFMFYNASQFNRDLRNWNFTSLASNTTTSLRFFLTGATSFSTTNYSYLLIHLANNTTQNNIRLDSYSSYFNQSSVVQARQSLIARGWTISDRGVGL